MFRLIALLFVAAVVGTVMFVNCGGGNSPTSTATSYYLNNGYCYNNLGQVVSNSYCSSTSNATSYYILNGTCYSNLGQPVDYSYCSTSSTGNTYTTTSDNLTICCPSGTATNYLDIGSGKNHGVYTNNPTANCCTAWEGPKNYGAPGCQITCQ